MAERGAHAKTRSRKENRESVCGMLGSELRLFLTPLRLPGEEKGLGDEMGELLAYDRSLANTLHQKDRVQTYGSFYIADIKAMY